MAAELRGFLKSSRHPVLCIGPMSVNAVDAVIKFANRIRKPIPLIASRRQIECKEFGGGYVNNWSTEEFAAYVKDRDSGFVPLCRDHGGPWQGGEIEKNLSSHEAMERAKHSMLVDLKSGFDLIHIDPSVKQGELSDAILNEMLFDLYALVTKTGREMGRKVEIEVGAEQQSGRYSSHEELLSFLKMITIFCEDQGFDRPLFCVVQTGTLVKEMRNVGFTEGRRNESYDQRYSVENMEKSVRHLSDLAYLNQVFVKEHNGDYLSDGSMALRRKLGVGGVNVAPEVGVFESKCLVTLAMELNLKQELDAMLELFYESKKWEKWLSASSEATDLEKAVIAGHYTFAWPEFIEIKMKIEREALSVGLDINQIIQSQIIGLLNRFIWNLGYFSQLKGLAKTISPALPRTSKSPMEGMVTV